MTYDWNTMVPITVPVGLNGWNYTGEVTINGQKVSFPVGKPTTVPEPVAEMLKAMIEREQENAGNTAKPNNHYIGDVTIPAGKSLTIAKGAEIVDENNAPTVILPETELTARDENMFSLDTPASATPTDGGTAIITYNGVEYTSPIIRAKDDETVLYAMGNTGLFGIPGGNADAPFFVLLFEQETDGAYGRFANTDGATSVTLSIVEKVETESTGGGSGGFIVKATCDFENNTATFDKTYEETLAAIKAGQYVACHVDDETVLIIAPATTVDTGNEIHQIAFSIYMGTGNLMVIMQSDGTGICTLATID